MSGHHTRLLLPQQPVAFPCPQTGRRTTGTIASVIVRGESLAYLIDAEGGRSVEVGVGLVLPAGHRRAGFVPGEDPAELRPTLRRPVAVGGCINSSTAAACALVGLTGYLAFVGSPCVSAAVVALLCAGVGLYRTVTES